MLPDNLTLIAPTPKNGLRRLTRTAYHEAGHAVLAAAIGDRPHFVSVRRDGDRLGVTMYRHAANCAASAVQIHLGGYAAEELLKGRRPGQLDQDIRFALLVRANPELIEVFEGEAGRDGWLAVRELLNDGAALGDDDLKGEVNRLYEVAKQSLIAVWPTVIAVAKALLRHEELDHAAIDAVIRGDIYIPVFKVQEAHGLMELRPRAC